MFLAALDAYHDWEEGEPEPTVEHQVNYVSSQIPISRACGLLWNCTDIIPSTDRYVLEKCGIELKAPRILPAAGDLSQLARGVC
ncbi:MAG TPA: hypothetical protein VFO40_09405 [Chthoniobacterales bacterium]|nr:hypothetical protein [Chthoniobacterales bacterium]